MQKIKLLLFEKKSNQKIKLLLKSNYYQIIQSFIYLFFFCFVILVLVAKKKIYISYIYIYEMN